MDSSTDQVALVASLEEQVAYLREVIRSRDEEIRRREEEYREESRRKDHLLAAALERIPEIEPPRNSPSAPREAPVPDEEGPPYGTSPQEAEESLHHAPYATSPPQEAEESLHRRSWWQRWFGG
jgi:hypothetical protein